MQYFYINLVFLPSHRVTFTYLVSVATQGCRLTSEDLEMGNSEKVVFVFLSWLPYSVKCCLVYIHLPTKFMIPFPITEGY